MFNENYTENLSLKDAVSKQDEGGDDQLLFCFIWPNPGEKEWPNML